VSVLFLLLLEQLYVQPITNQLSWRDGLLDSSYFNEVFNVNQDAGSAFKLFICLSVVFKVFYCELCYLVIV